MHNAYSHSLAAAAAVKGRAAGQLPRRPASTEYDVAVIGLGAFGSAACYHLALQGLKVLGLEQQPALQQQAGRQLFVKTAPNYILLARC
ncbi:N-methyl-L-tryptophan oxidase [Haematococcus lacustris]|uniref:N-methyl-L-tryptophan oxidase n=1 Tax=Haematococcus lacustris TaxID=44745 RepID=A0A699ZKG1_HAELA|nr:N-methyl-L-tryptophan oxidase [Haematococcus lacustris]